jgi:hypothetical protein
MAFGLPNRRPRAARQGSRAPGRQGRGVVVGPADIVHHGAGHPFDLDTVAPHLIHASETGPGPQLVTWGKSTILSVDAHGFKFEYTLNSAKHIPFDWVGP